MRNLGQILHLSRESEMPCTGNMDYHCALLVVLMINWWWDCGSVYSPSNHHFILMMMASGVKYHLAGGRNPLTPCLMPSPHSISGSIHVVTVRLQQTGSGIFMAFCGFIHSCRFQVASCSHLCCEILQNQSSVIEENVPKMGRSQSSSFFSQDPKL